MSKKKNEEKLANSQSIQKVVKELQSDKNNTLIIGGVVLAMSSIMLFVFVLSEKIFHLS